jgi:haloalkane dehalogenase
MIQYQVNSFFSVFLMVFVSTVGIIFLVEEGTGNYGVFGTEVSNMSRTNQTGQDNVSLPYEQNISAEFPFESNYMEVLGSKMHYIDEGEGDPILFIHGNPTSSYLWRNIIPYAEPYGRVIAVDLIGMGNSDKPDIGYRFVDHAKYIEGFIEKLDLNNITLVLHDWGSALGFNYGMQHEDNVKGIAFMEAFLRPLTWDGFPNNAKEIFQNIRTPEIGYDLVVNKNIFVEQLLPGAILRNLTEEEMNNYKEPYEMAESRIPVWVWPNEIPIDENPADVHKIVTDYNQWLKETELPKLLFYASPGGLINASMVDWSKVNLKNLETVDLGQGLHYLQEDHPHAIGKTLSNWIQQQKSKS